MSQSSVQSGSWLRVLMCGVCLAAPKVAIAAVLPLLVYDTFTGPDGTPLPSHAPDINLTGAGWVLVSGLPTPTLRGGRVGSRPGPGDSQLVIDCGTPDIVLATDVRFGGRALMQAIVRLTDADHYLMVQTSWAQGLKVFRREAAKSVLLGAGLLWVGANESHHLEIRTSGSVVEAWWDGVRIVTAVDTVQQGATRHGLAWHTGEDQGTTFDNLSLSGAAANRAPPTTAPGAGD